MNRRRAALGALVLGAAAVALAFLLLPIVAIFLRVPPGKLLHQLSSPIVTDALIVSIKTSAIAQALILLFGRRSPTCSRAGAFAVDRWR